MKKYSVLFLLLVCMLSGCSQKASWEFQYGHENVSEIKLVEMIGDMKYSVVEEIDISYANELFSDIDKLSWKHYGTNLSAPRDMCFLILYDSGEYDVISYYEPKHYRFEEGKLYAYNSWLCCDYENFQTLLEKYRQS